MAVFFATAAKQERTARVHGVREYAFLSVQRCLLHGLRHCRRSRRRSGRLRCFRRFHILLRHVYRGRQRLLVHIAHFSSTPVICNQNNIERLLLNTYYLAVKNCYDIDITLYIVKTSGIKKAVSVHVSRRVNRYIIISAKKHMKLFI